MLNSSRYHGALFKLFFLDILEKNKVNKDEYIQTVDDIYLRAVVNETHFVNKAHVDMFYNTICEHYGISKLEILLNWIKINLNIIKGKYIIKYLLKYRHDIDHYILNSTINDIYHEAVNDENYYNKLVEKGNNKLYKKLKDILAN